MSDPVFVWYILDILLRVPDKVFEDKWVSVATLFVDNIPGRTAHERVFLSQQVIMQTFGLWALPGKAAKLNVNFERLLTKLDGKK